MYYTLTSSVHMYYTLTSSVHMSLVVYIMYYTLTSSVRYVLVVYRGIMALCVDSQAANILHKRQIQHLII